MELSVIYKIKKDKKQYNYLRTHSIWYKYLNRDPKNYKLFLDSYKKFNRNVTTNKFSETLNSIDMITNVLSVLD